MKFLKILVLFGFFWQLCNVSAYTPYECGGNTLTASGIYAEEGTTIAADHLPFGTIVEIFGKPYIVQDRFGAGHTDRIDIFMDGYQEALNFGRQWLSVKVYMED